MEKIKGFVELFLSRLAGGVVVICLGYYLAVLPLRIVAPESTFLGLTQGLSLFFAITATLFFFFQQLGTLFGVPQKTAKKIRFRIIAFLYLLFFFGLAAMFFTESLWAFLITVVDMAMLYLSIFLVAFLAGATERQT